MTTYNLSEIMKAAHTMRKFRPEKYPTFSEALKRAWKVAKFNKEIADRRAETIACHETQKQEAQKKTACIAQIKAEKAEHIAMEVEATKRERTAKVEAESKAYGYGLGNHYSMFSGWGNYCGD